MNKTIRLAQYLELSKKAQSFVHKRLKESRDFHSGFEYLSITVQWLFDFLDEEDQLFKIERAYRPKRRGVRLVWIINDNPAWMSEHLLGVLWIMVKDIIEEKYAR